MLVGSRSQRKRYDLPGGTGLRVRASSFPGNDGTRVTAWPDESGGGFDMGNATAARKPLFCSAGDPDALPFVCFDKWESGNAAYRQLTNASFAFAKQAFTFLWVFDFLTVAQVAQRLLEPTSGSAFIVQTLSSGLLSVFYDSAAHTTTFRLPSDRRIALLITGSASAVNVYVDSVANVQAFAAASSATITGIFIGDSAGSFEGRVYEFASWPRALSAEEIGQAFGYTASRYRTGATLVSPVSKVIFDGDSTTHGVGATRNTPWPHRMTVRKEWLTYNFGVTSQTLATMITNQAVPNAHAGANNWLFCYAGYNDLGAAATGVTVEGRLNTYCTAAIGAGFAQSKIVVFTLSSDTPTTERDNANTLIRANYTTYAGWLVDIAADADLGVNVAGAHKVPGNFIDGVHCTDHGNDLLVALVRSTVTGLPF